MPLANFQGYPRVQQVCGNHKDLCPPPQTAPPPPPFLTFRNLRNSSAQPIHSYRPQVSFFDKRNPAYTTFHKPENENARSHTTRGAAAPDTPSSSSACVISGSPKRTERRRGCAHDKLSIGR